MISKMTRFILPLLVLPLFVVACDDDPTTTGTAEVSLLLTDALGDHVDNVWIEIDSIYLQGTGGRTVLFDAEEDNPDLGLVELTALGGDPDVGEEGVAVELISGVEVPPGTYGQLRFVIGSAVLESGGGFWSFNGAEVPEDHPSFGDFEASTPGVLKCPSCTQTGIKALLPQDEATIEEGSHIVVLDFDVGRSFGREAGMSGQWVMSPVIVATELEFSGAVAGTVDFARDPEDESVITATLPAECPSGTEIQPTAILDFFEVTATGTDDEEHTADVGTDGSYAFAVLRADTYTMGFTSPRVINDDGDALSYDDVDISETSVELASGTVVTVDYTINTVTCSEASSG